jgi:hypothetical protein
MDLPDGLIWFQIGFREHQIPDINFTHGMVGVACLRWWVGFAFVDWHACALMGAKKHALDLVGSHTK